MKTGNIIISQMTTRIKFSDIEEFTLEIETLLRKYSSLAESSGCWGYKMSVNGKSGPEESGFGPSGDADVKCLIGFHGKVWQGVCPRCGYQIHQD